MPLKPDRRRLEIPLTSAQYTALTTAALRINAQDVAALVRTILADTLPEFADAEPLPARGKYKRESAAD